MEYFDPYCLIESDGNNHTINPSSRYYSTVAKYPLGYRYIMLEN